MSLVGTLGVAISCAGGRVADVRLSPPSPAPLDRLLGGKTAEDAVSLVRMLFPLCGNAQAAAAATAFEQALGQIPSDAVKRARAVLVTAEALREHVGRIAVDWPALIDEKADPEPFAFLHRIVRDLQSGDEASTLGPAAAAARVAVSRLLLGDDRADFDVLASRPAIERWAASGVTPAARLMRRLLGGAPMAPFDETGTPLARRKDHPAVEAIAGTHGELAARVAARLVEAIALLHALEALAAGDATPFPIAAGRVNGPGSGWARVNVARGTLEHSVRLAAGHVADYSIDAPTTAHFSAGGAADRALRRLEGDANSIAWMARLTVLEFDPCVAHETTVT